MGEAEKTAAVIVIGNEILSGRTHDKNTHFIAQAMTAKGIRLREARVVPDDEAMIIEAVNALRAQYDYVFTTGGIGPTHDDITALCVAKAFGLKLERHEGAYAVLLGYYGKENLNAARLKMADLPAGAQLIDNPVTGAPGFNVENVYVMAGVPKIMQSMMEAILPKLTGGRVIFSLSVAVDLVESKIAETLASFQDQHPDIDIGSYPTFQDGKPKVSVVMRSTDEVAVRALLDDLQLALTNLGGAILDVIEL